MFDLNNLRTAFVFAFAVATVAAAAPPPNKGKPAPASAAVRPVSTPLERVDIDYDAIKRIAVAEHQTGYKALPPGIAKNLVRGKPLPPGIAKKAIPDSMVHQLPNYPDYEWKRCGTDLVLVQIGTQIVAEVLANIFH